MPEKRRVKIKEKQLINFQKDKKKGKITRMAFWQKRVLEECSIDIFSSSICYYVTFMLQHFACRR